MSPSPEYSSKSAEVDYQIKFRNAPRRAASPTVRKQSKHSRRSRRSRPSAFNGIHRRRDKRISW